ncbi:MAG: hypothetical protein JW760_15475, partial [Spirochaetales bacterium]|nr:hypothetical protein [Spirochaetales bacterium]
MLINAITRMCPPKAVFFILLPLLFLLPQSARCDMVYIEVSIPGEEELPIPPEVLGAFEDGIMDPFFQDWHIVCNGRKVKDIEKRVTEAVRGMDFYIYIDTLYASNQRRFGDFSIAYILKASDGEKVLLRGEHSSREFEDPNSPDPLEIYRLQGHSSAMEI